VRGYDDFKELAPKSRIICHGAGNNAYSMLNNEDFVMYRNRILFFVDKDETRIGHQLGCGENRYEIRPVSEVVLEDNVLVIVTICDYKKIGEYYTSNNITWFPWVEIAKEIAFSHLSEEISSPRFFLLNTPDYINMGDHAITVAQKCFLAKYNKKIYEFGSSLCDEEGVQRLKNYIRPNDIIFIQGGGNMGSLWKTCEENIRRIIDAFKENAIVIFPQSIFYENGDDGIYFKTGQLIYNSHPKLYICMRDLKSYKFVDENYACKSLLVPDMVLLLNERQDRTTRDGVGVLLRNDKERSISSDYAYVIEQSVIQCGMNSKIISHHSNELLGTRQERLQRVLDVYRSCKLVITDRLHGMVFSVITGTPCLVFDNSYAKISSLYETWLNSVTTIKVTSELSGSDLTEVIMSMLKTSENEKLDLTEKFDELDTLIKNIIKERENV